MNNLYTILESKNTLAFWVTATVSLTQNPRVAQRGGCTHPPHSPCLRDCVHEWGLVVCMYRYNAPSKESTFCFLAQTCVYLQNYICVILTPYIFWDTLHLVEILTISPKIAFALLWLLYWLSMGKNKFWENFRGVPWCFLLSVKKWI